LPQGPRARKRGTGLRRRQKRPQSGGSGPGLLQPGKLRADPVSPFPSPSAASALMGRIMTSNSTISPDSLNLMRSMPLSCHLPILAANSSATS